MHVIAPETQKNWYVNYFDGNETVEQKVSEKDLDIFGGEPYYTLSNGDSYLAFSREELLLSKPLSQLLLPDEIYIAEGYATAASINLATNKPVVAFDAGNLSEVAKIVREVFPKAEITIAADNDHKKEKNIGLEKATEAAKLIGAKIALPNFNNHEKLAGLTDFNDLHVSRQGEKGLKAVLESVKNVEKSKGLTI